MPDRRSLKLPVILRAAITLDGKLDDGTSLQTMRGTQVEALDPARCRDLLATGGVDEIHLTVRPRIGGRLDSPTLNGPPTPDFFLHSVALRLLRMETRDGECLLHYRVLRPARKSSRAG